jgi:hypothetical protein
MSEFKSKKYEFQVYGDRDALVRFRDHLNTWARTMRKADVEGDMYRPDAVGVVDCSRRITGSKNGTYGVTGASRKLNDAKEIHVAFETRPEIPCPIEDFVAKFPELVFDGGYQIIDGAEFLAVNGKFKAYPYVEEEPFEYDETEAAQ